MRSYPTSLLETVVLGDGSDVTYNDAVLFLAIIVASESHSRFGHYLSAGLRKKGRNSGAWKRGFFFTSNLP